MIGIIARHESVSLLRNTQTWIMAALLAGLFGYQFLKQLEAFVAVQAQLAVQDHPVGLTGFMSVRYLEPLALAFTLVAPLFAMRSFSEEYRQHTYALWQSSPVSSLSLVAGKFLGIFLVLLLPLALAVLMLNSMQFYLSIDWPLLATSTLGLVLCTAACTACGMYFSSLTRHALIAITSSLALLFISWMLGSTSTGLLPLQSLSSLSIASRLRGFFQGYLQSGDIAFFVLMTVLFAGLSVIRLDSLRQAGRTHRLSLILSLLLLGICLSSGWLAQRFSLSFDITANQRHSLTPTTTRVLQSMDSPVELIAVLGPDPAHREGVRALVSRFQDIKPDLHLRFINPETDPAAARQLDAAPGGELILRAANREQRLQNLSERTLANSLRLLTREGDRDIVFITGHDERSPVSAGNDDWNRVAAELAGLGLISREVSLVSHPYLDDDIDLLVLAAPRRPYFPGELASIVDYLARGGNLLWMSEIASDSPTGPGLQLLADNLGVDTLPGTTIDTASQALKAQSPDFVLLDRFPAHPITAGLTSPVLLPQAQALAVTPLAGQHTQPLLQTPESSWTESGPLTGEIRFDENTGEVAGPLLLGVTIERSLAQGTQRFAVLGDADLGASQFVDNGANRAFIESLLLWLTGESDALEFVTQKAADSELVLSNRSIIGLTAVYLVGFPTVLLVGAVLVRWRRRK
ncbi:MAG: ABC transporter permease subunit [Granulosicoccus sp.]|nr:ABC transporter permease subunit [Granulosicoccus sp.]